MSVRGILVLDGFKHFVAVNVVAALVDDSIADFTDKDNQAGWRVVVLRVGPDEQNGVHDGHEELNNLMEVFAGVNEVTE